MEIKHNEKDMRFFASLEGGEAELTYSYPTEKVMDFDHTFVPKEARGNGVANDLVVAGLEYAKSNGYQIIPSCPVVEAYVKRHPEYQDMVSDERI